MANNRIHCECCGGNFIVKYFIGVPDVLGGHHTVCPNCGNIADQNNKTLVFDMQRRCVIMVDRNQAYPFIVKRCNLCGNTFSFDANDVYRNVELAKAKERFAMSSVYNTFVGGYTVAQLQGNQIGSLESQMRDFNRCPNCGSTDLRILSKQEYDQIRNANNQLVQPQKPSEADEIMKFKDLLDKGIITEEEFEAKKNQLLGL